MNQPGNTTVKNLIRLYGFCIYVLRELEGKSPLITVGAFDLPDAWFSTYSLVTMLQTSLHLWIVHFNQLPDHFAVKLAAAVAALVTKLPTGSPGATDGAEILNELHDLHRVWMSNSAQPFPVPVQTQPV